MRQLLGTTRKSQANDVSTEESYVRFGSLADISERTRDVRFTPESGHAERQHRRPLSANRRQARGFKRGYHLGRQRRVAIRRDANEVPIKGDRSVHIRAVGHAKQGCEVLGRACQHIVAPDIWRFTLQEVYGL